MTKIILQLILIFSCELCFGQYTSVDTLYYPNKQIERIMMQLEGDSVTIQKRYYSQYLKSFVKHKKDKIQSIETYVKHGENGMKQEGYAEYWYKNGKKKEEIIYSRKNGNRYINQWGTNFEQNLKSGEGVYIVMDFGVMGMDSLVCEVRDSLLHGKYRKYTQNEKGEYVLRSAQYFIKNEPRGTKITYDLQGVKIIEEEYSTATDSISYTGFYLNGQVSKTGTIYRDRKFGVWKDFSATGEIEKECMYENDYASGKYMEFYPSGVIKVEGGHKLITQEGEEEVLRFDMLKRKKIITKEKLRLSVKDGKWIYRDEADKILKVELYKEGELIDE